MRASSDVTTVCFHVIHGVGELRRRVDELIESGVANYGDCESMESLHQIQARLDSFVTEATAAFEAGEEWAADGAKTAASWVATRCRVARRAAKRRVRLGRTLRHLPAGGQGLARGRHRDRPGRGHRLGPTPPHRGLHGP